MAAKKLLTMRDVDGLAWNPDGPSIQLHADAKVPGLYVRVYASGRKTYVIRYRPHGAAQPKLFTIGQDGVFTLDQARKAASRELHRVRDAKSDPVAERKQAREEAREEAGRADTLRDFAAVYMDQHAKKHKRSWKEDERRLRLHILPALGSKRLQDVQRSDIARLHTKIGATRPVEANRVVEVLALLFSKACEWSHLPEDHRNPARGIKAYHEADRERWVSEEEMPLLWQAIAAEESPYIRAALRLYLLTGLRKNELLQRRRSEVKLDRKVMEIPTTKNDKSHTVPLSDAALAEIDALPRMVGNPYLFPSSVKPRAHIANIVPAWRRVRGRLWMALNPEEAVALRVQAERDIQRKHVPKGAEALEAHLITLAAKRASALDLRLHDLRRTVGSWMANSGVSLQVIGKTLNNPSAAALYARLRDSAPREALQAHGERLTALATGKAG